MATAPATAIAQPAPERLLPLYEQRVAAQPTGSAAAAAALRDLALFLRSLGQLEAAAAPLQQALAIDERLLGPRHSTTCLDLDALALLRPSLPLWQRAAECQDGEIAARYLAKLSAHAEESGQHERALAFARQALLREPRPEGKAIRMNDLALLSGPQEAERLLRQALLLQKRQLSRPHPELATTEHNLATLLFDTGRGKQAKPFALSAHEQFRQLLGDSNSRTQAAAELLRQLP